MSSLGVYSGHLTMPLEAISAGLADQAVVTTLCPGGKERMRRLMSVVRAKRFPFHDLVTHSFRLDQIHEAYDLFSNQRDGVMIRRTGSYRPRARSTWFISSSSGHCSAVALGSRLWRVRSDRVERQHDGRSKNRRIEITLQPNVNELVSFPDEAKAP